MKITKTKKWQAYFRKNMFGWYILAFLLCVPVSMSAQKLSLNGTVVDEQGEAVIGATV